MSHTWQLQEAKNKFSNLVERAQQEGPQVVTKHGKETVIVLSVDDYKKITKPKDSLVQFLQKSPLGDVEMDLSRNKGTTP
ncbi:MAG: type II toxin-antitoxin system Phd/YefM family antitoxin [Desulfurivibrionaceae bacterium]|jgi:prevent-host-death family protein